MIPIPLTYNAASHLTPDISLGYKCEAKLSHKKRIDSQNLGL